MSRSSGAASPSVERGGSRPAGISRWAEKKRSLNLQPYLGRSPSVSSEVDILRDSLRSTVRFRKKTFFLRTVWTARFQNFPVLKMTLTTEGKPGRTFRPSCSSSAQFWVQSFSSSNLTDVTGCVLPNPEVCVSGNGAQLPAGDRTAGTATPDVRFTHDTAQTS